MKIDDILGEVCNIEVEYFFLLGTLLSLFAKFLSSLKQLFQPSFFSP